MSVQLRSKIVFMYMMLFLLTALNDSTWRRKFRKEEGIGTSFRVLLILRLFRKIIQQKKRRRGSMVQIENRLYCHKSRRKDDFQGDGKDQLYEKLLNGQA